MIIAVNLQELVHALEAIVGFKFLDARVYFMSDLPAHVRAVRCAAHLRICIRAGVHFHRVPGGACRALVAGRIFAK